MPMKETIDALSKDIDRLLAEVRALVFAIRSLHPDADEEPVCPHECLECSALKIGGCEDSLRRAMKPFRKIR